MKLASISLLVMPLLIVAAAGIVWAAPSKSHAAPAPTARDRDAGKDDADAALDDPDPSAWGGGPAMGMWRGGMGPGGMGMHRPGMGGRMAMGARLLGPEGRLLRGAGPLADQLKLTGTQREKLRSIGGDLARKAIRARADLAVAHLDLSEALRKDSASRQEAEEQIDAITKLEASLMKEAVSARLDARALLTADQRKQLEELRWSGPREREGATGAPRGRAGTGRGGRTWRP
jgi:Spy/CpxP family protein refolding chaperone